MFVYILTFLLSLVLYTLYKLIINDNKNIRKSSRKAILPPGSMGWPYIGETIQLYSQDPNFFFSTRQRRYGEIFKTRILGYPCIMLASPEAARFVLVSQAQLFKPTYPKSKENLIGPSALFFHQGDYHENIRKLVKRSLSPDTIRNLVPEIESSALSLINSWSDGAPINTYQQMKKYSFEVGILSIFGQLEVHLKEELYKNYSILNQGYNSFPTNLPGTSYRSALKARKRMVQILGEILKERENMQIENNLLSGFLNLKDKDNRSLILDEEQIIDNIIGVLFAAQDTTASVITWILKYLHDYPKLLEAVMAEQKTIQKSKDKEDCLLTWKHTRNMPITYKVMLETLRMATIISFTFREAVTDVEYKGFLIPKGWKVMPLFRNIHHNPEFFTDPQKFDPSRFEVAPKPNTFMPFGSGVHSCPGNALAKQEILVMVHHLVTKFRWEVLGSQSGIQYGPFPVPIQGLPARFWKESSI
ncbi:hypothetical protein Leryth_024628 [Lithospermum erythrorhizon]|uniref:(+)-abscisic acid 8'-hydroxylase n=1 Tax=Lithospermum erythrorhizon TaxID=34254 RepID=A0AAV3QDY1_LITER|nr:hypothetical protein Leryth_024628 [Lithospermum erythrorhizon]